MRVVTAFCLFVVGCGACGEPAEPPQDVVPVEQDVPCQRDPRFVAWVNDGQTSVSHANEMSVGSVHIVAEVRSFEGVPPLAVTFGDYSLRVLEDLTVCVDVAP